MMSEKKEYQSLLNGICLLISGLSVGWLVGLSVSPVIQTVLTSVIAIIVGISSALAGLSSNKSQDDSSELTSLKRKPPTLFDPVPIMFLVFGIAIGAPLGVYGRTNNWFGPKSNAFAEEWKDTGLKREEIALRVFNSLYPPTSQTSAGSGSGKNNEISNTSDPPGAEKTDQTNTRSANSNSRLPTKPQDSTPQILFSQRTAGVLFTVSLDECKRLRNVEGDDLRREMASSKEGELNRLAKNCKTEACLKAGIEKVCAKYPR